MGIVYPQEIGVMITRTNLHDESLKTRLRRLINGDLQVEDITKLYTGKRSASYGRSSFKELADFIAHPDIRNRGPVTDRLRDMRTSFKPMLDKSLNNERPDLRAILERAEANFRMASDEQIVQLSKGHKRKYVQKVLRSAVEKLHKGEIDSMQMDEQSLAINFGDRIIWNPALLGQEVFDDFKYVMIKNGLVEHSENDKLDNLRTLVILHAISVMHGSAFDLGDGMTGELQAGFDNPEKRLEVTAILMLKGYPKLVSMKVGLFWTDLFAYDHLEPVLIEHPHPWTFAIEVIGAQIRHIGNITPQEVRQEETAVINIK